MSKCKNGGVAQMEERVFCTPSWSKLVQALTRIHQVVGSMPTTSTMLFWLFAFYLLAGLLHQQDQPILGVSNLLAF